MGNVYSHLYDTLRLYVFQESELIAGSAPDMIATLVATFGTIFLISLPFIVVWKFIKMICG